MSVLPLIRFNKPYGVLSQFTAEGRWRGLKDFIDLPDFYAAGRLDADSEGLLLLTDDGRLQAQIADPRIVRNAFDLHPIGLGHLEAGIGDPDTPVHPDHLAGTGHPRRSQSPGEAHDGGGRVSHAQADPRGHRPVHTQGAGARRMAR